MIGTRISRRSRTPLACGPDFTPELVADEEIARDPLDLLAVHEEVAAPPALELEEARWLGVGVGEYLVVLVDEGVGRIQVLEVLHEVRAVEFAVAHVRRATRAGCRRACRRRSAWGCRLRRHAMRRPSRTSARRRSRAARSPRAPRRRASSPPSRPGSCRRWRAWLSGCSARTLCTNSRSAAHTSSSVCPGSGSRKNMTK